MKIIEIEQNCDYQVLDYLEYRKGYEEGWLGDRIAQAYGKTVAEVNELASDPSHGGKQTLSSYLETMVGFELEEKGIFGISMKRGPIRTNLEDGWGRKWDVTTPPYVKGIGFNEQSAVNSILRKFKEFPIGDVGILVDVSFLNKKNYLELQNDLKNKLSNNQKFLVRQVIVKGIL